MRVIVLSCGYLSLKRAMKVLTDLGFEITSESRFWISLDVSIHVLYSLSITPWLPLSRTKLVLPERIWQSRLSRCLTIKYLDSSTKCCLFRHHSLPESKEPPYTITHAKMQPAKLLITLWISLAPSMISADCMANSQLSGCFYAATVDGWAYCSSLLHIPAIATKTT